MKMNNMDTLIYSSWVRRLAVTAALLVSIVGSVSAEEIEHLDCGVHGAAHAAAEGEKAAPPRRFAPDRLVDVLHLKLDVTPDFRARTVAGTATITFKPIAKPLPALVLHQKDLDILEVSASHAVRDHDKLDEELRVTFERPIPAGETASVVVRYEAEPKEGLYFRTRELGYAPGDEHIWTQGETHEARHWYPSFDYPNERFTSEIVCRVPADMTVLSNGTEVSNEVDAATGLRTSRWKIAKPHVNYLVALVAGHLRKLSATHRDTPIGLYVQPSEFAEAENTFDGIVEMMKFFEDEIGVPYPWSRYNQVTIFDPHFGGMENTTLTTLNVLTLHRKDVTGNLRDSRGLVAHELVHQWFGDYVTCKDWSHIWLNEGFATYYSQLHLRHVKGEDEFRYAMLRQRDNITGRKDRTPVVQRRYENANRLFTYRAYTKGSWILHMLRAQLGEDLFRKAMRTYLERNALKSVVTEDLNRVLEAVAGRSFDPFFDQWVYHARHPELDVRYAWDAATGLAKVSVAQKQKVDDDVVLFAFPVTLRFKGDGWSVDHAVEVTGEAHDFYVPLKAKPEVVRFDPELTVLADVNFRKPKGMLFAQLSDTTDVLGRLLAAKALGSHKDLKTVERLKQALNDDPFQGVRRRASEALGKIGTPEALRALAASTTQPDDRVRHQVARDIATFYHPEARRASARMYAAESNPMISRHLLRSLAKYRGDDAKRAITEAMRSDTYRDFMAYYAQEAIPTYDDPDLTGEMIRFITKRDRKVNHAWFGNTLETLGRLNRNEDRKDRVRDLLAGYANDPSPRIRRGAIKALGLLEDPKAIPIVSSFTGSGDEKTAVERAAEEALKKLRARKEMSAEVKDLTAEVMQLKEKSEKLESEVEDLKQQLKAKEKVAADPEKDDTQGDD